MSDVILVYPATGFDIAKVSVDLPLSVLSLASTIVSDYNVKIIDQRVDKKWKLKLRKELRKDPLCVGISSMTGFQIKNALDASKIVKTNSDNVQVVWGGVHASLLPQQTLENENVDIVVQGEGEITFKEIVGTLEKGKPLNGIKGVWYKHNEKLRSNPPRELVDLNKLPEIPYDLVEIERYVGSRSMVHDEVKRTLPFISSRGCPHNCKFCCNPVLSKQIWRYMSPERTASDVLSLAEEFNLDTIVFHDENFFANLKRVKRIAGLLGGKINWTVQARIDDINFLNLYHLEKNGLRMIQPGVESGSDRILKLINKGITVKDILKANKKLGRTDIISVYNFMMGFPTENINEIFNTVDLSLKLLKENKNSWIAGFYVFVPYPGTELFNLAVKEGFNPPLSLEEWAEFDRQHLKTPWIQDKLDIIKNIVFTSKFVDGNRLKTLFRKKIVPKFLFSYLGRSYRKRWADHNFKDNIPTTLLKYLGRVYSYCFFKNKTSFL